jgi:hypothetical protein
MDQWNESMFNEYLLELFITEHVCVKVFNNLPFRLSTKKSGTRYTKIIQAIEKYRTSLIHKKLQGQPQNTITIAAPQPFT